MNKKLEDFPNYCVNEQGQVFNVTTNKELKGSIGLNGYKYYRLSNQCGKKMFYAHRLVAEYFLDNPNNYPVVNHLDGNKQNNAVENLEWTTYSGNNKHAHNLSTRKSVSKKEYYTDDLADEKWYQIKEYPYSISSCGRVKNNKTLLLLKPSIVCGYQKITLCKNNQVKDFMIHNLLYMTVNNIKLIPNNYVVDHIDGNKLNNSLTNLRLITLSENVKSAYYDTCTNSNLRKVGCYKNGKLIKTFDSIREAGRALNLDASTISKVCRGKNKSHGGYTFQYLD